MTGEVWINLKQNIIDTAVNVESVSICVRTIQTILLHTVEKTKQLDKMATTVNKICVCALFRLSNNTVLGKNISLDLFPQVVHKQTLGEVEN